MTIVPGEHVAVTGPSGSGRTTLLHRPAGILVPDAGQVLLAGVPRRVAVERAGTWLGAAGPGRSRRPPPR